MLGVLAFQVVLGLICCQRSAMNGQKAATKHTWRLEHIYDAMEQLRSCLRAVMEYPWSRFGADSEQPHSSEAKEWLLQRELFSFDDFFLYCFVNYLILGWGE